jgi:hypothetical protein
MRSESWYLWGTVYGKKVPLNIHREKLEKIKKKYKERNDLERARDSCKGSIERARGKYKDSLKDAKEKYDKMRAILNGPSGTGAADGSSVKRKLKKRVDDIHRVADSE